MKTVLVTGGGGYVGSVLVQKLLRHGYTVKVLDLFLYEKKPFRDIPDEQKRRLQVHTGDIRNERLYDFVLEGVDVVIHLACISNDPSFDLDPRLGKSINLDAFTPFVKACRDRGVKRFINASSSSVYGVSDEPRVTEKTPCKPLTDYSKFKLETELILKSFDDYSFTTVSVRSATVCGYSPRQRLDVIVNIFANQAYNLGEITVTGGQQRRPNVHIKDIAECYVKLVEAETALIEGDVFNFGSDNYSVEDIALLVQHCMRPKLVALKYHGTNDPRSYHICSDKIKGRLDIVPVRKIGEAVYDLKQAFDKKLLPNSLQDSKYFNIKRLKEVILKDSHAVAELH